MGFWTRKDKRNDSPFASFGFTNPFDSAKPSILSSYTSVAPSDEYESAPGHQGGHYDVHRDDSEYNSPQRNPLFGNDQVQGQQHYGCDEKSALFDHGHGDRGASCYAEEEDEKVSGLKTQIRNVKQDTLESTRNTLRKLAETEDSASTSMGMLQEQSDQIVNVGCSLDLSKAYSDRAIAQTSELKQLNQSILIPVVKNPFNRSKRAFEGLQCDQSEHMEEGDGLLQYEYESNARMEEVHRNNNSIEGPGAAYRGHSETDHNRYQFNADSEDDEVENEIDDNLGLIGGAAARLKNMAVTMNQVVLSQNQQLDHLYTQVDPLTQRLAKTTHTLNSTR